MGSKSLTQATCCLCFNPGRSVIVELRIVYESQMYLQRRASLEQQHILDADDVQETKPTSSDHVPHNLTTFNGLLEIRRC